jgi:hypothetical protein
LKVIRTCKQCGQDYETFPSIRLVYCGQACYGAAKRRGKEVACIHCGTLFYRHASKPDRQYCSLRCSTSARNLTDWNPSKHRDISGAKNPMYGRGMKGADNPMFGRRKELAPRWKGGRRVRKDGYVIVVVPDDHTNPSEQKASGTKYMLEHRLIAEQALGRPLDPKEVVHHKDEIHGHNTPDNLEVLRNQAEHARIHIKKRPRQKAPAEQSPSGNPPA